MGDRIPVGTMAELKSAGFLTGGTRKLPVCVFLDEAGEPRALDNRCPHMGSLLNLGEVKDGTVICHWHGAAFDLKTGKSLDDFVDDVGSFPVEMEGDDIYVVVP